jgi:competence protein ComEA
MRTFKNTLTGLLAGLLFFLCCTNRIMPVSLERQFPDTIEAEVKGAVQNPGVYTLKYGASVSDLIEQAGGLSENADTSQISLAGTLQDRQVVVIREASEQAPLISINTATLEELQQLPGVGPAMAQRIIDYRQQSPFQSLEEIMQIKGIKEKMFEKIRELICL